MKNNRIVPDIFRAIFNNKKIYLRNPQSTRPWQHVLELFWLFKIRNLFIRKQVTFKKYNTKLELWT